MNDITITETNGKITLSAPYHPDANAGYRRLGGRWNPTTKTWAFDARDLDAVRGHLVHHFGHDDRGAAQTVTVLVHLEGTYSKGDNVERRFGRVLARRAGRDDDVRLGEGVIIRHGTFPGTGGSRNNPSLGDNVDVVLEVRDVPAGHVDLDDADVQIIDDTTIDIDAAIAAILGNTTDTTAETPAEVDVDALITEREALIARLAEIDAMLPEPEGTEMSTREAATALGVSVRTVQRWASTGKVAASKDGSGRWTVTITVNPI